jgi:hypothetical protein
LIQKIINKGELLNVTLEYIACNICIYNKSVFDLDYKAMSNFNTNIIYSELLAKALHPSKIEKWLDYYIANGGNLYDFNI